MNLKKPVLLLALFASASVSATVQDDFHATLDTVKAAFEDRYALAPWKQQFFGWTINGAYRRIRREGDRDPNLTVERARSLVQDFFLSARDYHAAAFYPAGGYTSLPVSIRASGAQAFITGVQDDCACGLTPGDEVLEFDGQPVLSALRERRNTRYPNHPLSDGRDAERRLTNPYGMLMEKMPTADEAVLKVKTLAGPVVDVRLPWKRPAPSPAASLSTLSNFRLPPKVPADLIGWMKGPGDDGRAAGMDYRGSIFPKPATVSWEAPADSNFPAWIAEFPGAPGKKVGWVRVPHFAPNDFSAAVREFEATIDRMNRETDVLIVDELSNSGGMADYMYALFSYFIDREVPTFKFSYRLSPSIVAEVRAFADELAPLQTEADAKTYFGEDYAGFPVDLDFLQDVKAFTQSILDDAAAGLEYQRPMHYDSARIKPNPRVRYLKPVFVLADARTVSCGDFFAALFQDTGRAEVLGELTMGGGAFIGDNVAVSNPLGVSSLRIPLAMGFRLDGRTPIENIGVIPDAWFQPTSRDFQSGFAGYAAGIYGYIGRKLRY